MPSVQTGEGAGRVSPTEGWAVDIACGCSKRARAAARGQTITGYRVTAPDGTIIPAEGRAPFFSQAEARAEIRRLGGGTARAEYRKTA